MSRISLETPKTLDELIPEYAANKLELDSYKKICDDENAEIKRLMEESEISKYSAGGYVATKVVSTRETVDEEKLLAMMRKYGITEAIKTREYVDMDVLEKYLYNHEITPDFADDFYKCRDVKEVVTLQVKKEK